MSAPRQRTVSTRSIAVSLVIVVLATIGSAAMTRARGRDLSGAITSVRGSQIAAESSMRAADLRISSLQRLKKKSQRSLRRSRRRHDRFIERRSDVREHARAVRAELTSARAGLDRAKDELAALLLEQDIIGAALAAPSVASAALGLSASPASAGAVSKQEPGAPDQDGDDPAIARLQGTVQELQGQVDRLEAQSRRAARTTRRVERSTRRAGRREAAAKRRIRSIRAGIRSATGQQQGSEATLAAYIQSMSRLAHLRANKKTKGRAAPAFGMPVHGRLTQGYHAGHDGIDIAAGRGTPIRAMAQGVVAYVGWNPWDSRPRAFVVVLAHQGGYETKYGHLLPRRGVVLGELVRRGEVIGYMGNTGHSTGVHLHLEVSLGFRTINPYAVL